LFSHSTKGSGSNISTVFTFAQNFTCNKGDQFAVYLTYKANFTNDTFNNRTLFIYGKNTVFDALVSVAQYQSGFGDCEYFVSNITQSITAPIPSTNPNPSYINMIGNTSLLATQSDAVLLHDVGLSVCDRITGKDDSFYSSFLGGQYSEISYPSNGCGYLNTLLRGLNLRGYTFLEKPFTISFDDYWAGINPMFNLGLGYEELQNNSPGSTVIRIERKSYFFDPTPSVYLTAINDITVEFDLNLFTKTIEIGFEQWQAESASGIDDPQTKHTYSVRFKLFGKDEKQLSKFVAASLAIEQGRRLTKLQSQDWRLDENVFVIALQEQDAALVPETSPPTNTQQPEVFNVSPSTITNLNNPTTRYNVRHTPARMMERWLDFYNGQLQSYPSEAFKFQAGEGNILMGWSGDGSCDNGAMVENQNVNVSSDYLFLPIVYIFTHPLTWDEYTTIRDNRNKGISISWIDPYGQTQVKVVFIRKLQYDINKSKGNFEVWITGLDSFDDSFSNDFAT